MRARRLMNLFPLAIDWDCHSRIGSYESSCLFVLLLINCHFLNSREVWVPETYFKLQNLCHSFS